MLLCLSIPGHVRQLRLAVETTFTSFIAGPVSRGPAQVCTLLCTLTAFTIGLQGLSAEDLAALLAQVSLHSVEAQLPFEGSQTPARRTPAQPRRSRAAAAVAADSESSDEDAQVGICHVSALEAAADSAKPESRGG